MKQQTKNYSLTACALAVSALLSACGGGGGVVDDVLPTVAIAAPTGLVNGKAVFTLTFSEDVGDSFVLEDVTVTGSGTGAATLTPKAESDGLVYELSVPAPTVASGQTADIKVSVAADKFEDLVGNANLALAEGTFTIDKKAPVADTTNPVQPVYANGVATFTLKFDEPVSLKDANLITVTNGTKGALTPSTGSASTFTLAVTPSTGAATVTVNVGAGSFQDVQGNALGTAFSQTATISDPTPTGTSLLPNDGLTASGWQLGTGGSATAASGVVTVVLGTDSGKDSSGANALAGVLMSTQTGGTVPTFSLSPQQKTVQLRIKAPGAATKVKLKFEKTGTTVTAEADAVTQANNNDWQTLTFTFDKIKTTATDAGSALTSTVPFDKIVLFPDADFTRVARTINVDDVILMPASTSTQDPNSVLPDAGLAALGWQLGTGGSATAANGVVTVVLAADSGKDATGANALAGVQMSTQTGGTVAPFSLSPTQKTVQLRIKAPGAATKVKLKFEKSGATPTVTAEADAETVANNNDWQTLTFTFDKIMTGGVEGALTAAVQFDKIVLFPDVNYTRVARTISVDDVILLPAEEPTNPGEGEVLPDAGLLVDAWGLGTNGKAEVVSDGTTTGNKVIKVDIGTGAESGAGVLVYTNDTTKTVPTFVLSSVQKYAKLLVKAPGAATKIQLKFENTGSTVVAKAEATTKANNDGWQELIFTFDKLYTKSTTGEVESGSLNGETAFNKIAIFPDFGTTPTARTIYFDTVTLMASSTKALVDFQGDVEFTSYAKEGETKPEVTIPVLDPAGSTTNKVAKVKIFGKSISWAGVLFGTSKDISYTVNNSQSVFGSSGSKKLVLRVRGENGSLPAGFPVNLRVEQAGYTYADNRRLEAQAIAQQVTTADGWQTLTFDFDSGLVSGSPAFNASYVYNKVSVYFNIGKDSLLDSMKTYNFDIDHTYYFDDLRSVE
ncbi:Ig-like domain-containing protein [Candidatus Symbiobacter mobilis]|uniref:Bacterial Ig-like domain-containing protein n=1 Tax=Candidatus Symbiobacter mobilis CR TaxID=946483 RepID=U5NDD1_9BURK|nr:Ig-like domain-containing protein [Candidatus Symbiobacter mobilis]AGX88184.1 hypothetical protein Cenrod_2113 [Candidatus Symbiobacter mobilis CR]